MEKKLTIVQVILPVVIALGVIAALFVLFSTWGVSSQAENKDVTNGILNLSDWSFEDGGNVKLDGDWEFYWDQIIMPEEFVEGTPEMTGTYPVPMYWTKYTGLNLPSMGEATYRLVLTTDEEDEWLGLSIPELYTEYALYINGQLLVGNGDLGGTSLRFLNPSVFMFQSEDGRAEIVLQMKNRTHVNAGIGQSFVIGTPDNIFWKNNVEVAIDLILIGICLFAGIYHLVLYLNRKKEYKLLCFSLFCFAVAIRGLIANTTYIMYFFPQLPFFIGSRIVTETILLLTVSMLLYVYYMFRNHISRWLVQILVAISAIYSLITLFADSFVYTSLFNWYLIVSLIVCGVGLYVAFVALKDRSREAVLYLTGTLFIVAGTVNDILVFKQNLDTGYRLGVGLAVFAVIQSFIMAMQYSRFTNERKQLYDKLHETDLAFMQAQIKPHFIYNALSAISYTVGKDPKKAKELLLDFSDYLRGCFDFSNAAGLTTLAKEMDIVKAYLSIEKERFQDRLNVEYSIEENSHVLIPMLSIQPIVENAVRHGLMPRAEGGTVTIKVWNEKGATHIRVEDDGVGMSESRLKELLAENTSSTGLKNINGRLKLKFGTELKITNREEGGTCVEFAVPRKPQPISGIRREENGSTESNQTCRPNIFLGDRRNKADSDGF